MNSTRMNWPYPAYLQDGWYSAFEGLVEGIDVSCHASQEDRNIFPMGGGDFSFVVLSGAVTWTAQIELLAANAGVLWTVAPSTVFLTEGQFMYVELARGPSANTALTPGVASSLPSGVSGDNMLVLAVRRNNRVYFRSGQALMEGPPAPLLETSARKTLVPICINGWGGTWGWETVGAFQFDPADWTGYSTMQFVLTGFVNGYTGDADAGMRLYDVTNDVEVALFDFLGVNTTTTVTSALLPVPTAGVLYAVQIGIFGGGSMDNGTVWWAGLRLTT